MSEPHFAIDHHADLELVVRLPAATSADAAAASRLHSSLRRSCISLKDILQTDVRHRVAHVTSDHFDGTTLAWLTGVIILPALYVLKKLTDKMLDEVGKELATAIIRIIKSQQKSKEARAKPAEVTLRIGLLSVTANGHRAVRVDVCLANASRADAPLRLDIGHMFAQLDTVLQDETLMFELTHQSPDVRLSFDLYTQHLTRECDFTDRGERESTTPFP